jgi:hypothetical protein
MNKHERYAEYESEVHGKAKIYDRLREAERDQLARLAQGEQPNGIGVILKRLSNFFQRASFKLEKSTPSGQTLRQNRVG